MGAGDCGTMRTRRVLQCKYYTREYCCHDKRERKRERWERGLSNDREAVLQLKKRRGFIHLQSEEKEGIIDESAAYNFSAANQTSGEITLYSQ